ncbi:MAG: helix-turn-helix transcriptional regulator [Deinococcales bacterium]
MEDSLNAGKARRILAQNIRYARKRQKISQEELADRAGIHRTYVGAIERGKQNVSIDNIERISVALGLTPAELLTEGTVHEPSS